MRPAAVPGTPSVDPTHACLRCGAPIPIDESLCERCNPLGLPAPAATQAHGSIFLAIVVAVAVIAVLGRVAMAGVGPFSGTVTAVAASGPGLSVTLSVRNEGSHAGSTTCRVFDPAQPGLGPESAYVLSPEIGPGQARTFRSEVTSLGPTVRPLDTDCH